MKQNTKARCPFCASKELQVQAVVNEPKYSAQVLYGKVGDFLMPTRVLLLGCTARAWLSIKNPSEGIFLSGHPKPANSGHLKTGQ